MSKRKRVKHPQGVLVKRTRELLIASSIPYPDIFKATDIQPYWLSLFACDKIPDPGINKVEVLYTFLNGGPLVIG